MALTTLDAKTALVVIDLQRGIVGLPTAPHPSNEIVERSAVLLDAFRRHGLPVVLVNVAAGAPGRTDQGAHTGEFPAEFVQLVPELKQQPSDHLVTKRTWGAFTNTDLAAWLHQQGVTQVVLVGIATSIGVESTARFASEHGFNVTLVTDAMTDLNADAHVNSITRIFPRLGETGTVQQVLDLLEKTRA
ncbi:isochorismatase family protein [Paraburkholderia sp. MMS20-SJTR3]|uniref:Isochorismatase family protein n=1 Tax=Paraburkholderia sejongensis TaxID=2886946 RepID=A0ABS8JXJ5_9BURK|nr:isochorismatase family protein [Paraburkholderia sp. MMS20-SJTR3]MCC8394604.1 isochorismatase family protein [Paraburkholderia sp. MMS20-SJTR3]